MKKRFKILSIIIIIIFTFITYKLANIQLINKTKYIIVFVILAFMIILSFTIYSFASDFDKTKLVKHSQSIALVAPAD